MTQSPPAWGTVLQWAAAIRPHYFNSFYRRVRVIRDDPTPAMPAVTVDVTHRCALKCPFCIAASTREHRDMPMQLFETLAQELKGIHRLTLIGGEPAQHPQFSRLLEAARECATEVEVFTNGIFLGDSGVEGARKTLESLIQSPDANWLALVLSVDSEHRDQMPAGRLMRAVDTLLQLQEAGVTTARFSITHPNLNTGHYLDSNTVADAIAEVSQPLAAFFKEGIDDGTVNRHFYFNAVVRGSTDAPLTNTTDEYLRLEDMVFSPEPAFTFDERDNLQSFSNLPSVWSRPAPPGAHLGSSEVFSARVLAQALRLPENHPVVSWMLATPWKTPAPPSNFSHLLDQHLESARRQGEQQRLLSLLGAWAPLERFLSKHQVERLATQEALAMHAFIQRGLGDQTVRVGGDEEQGPTGPYRFVEFARQLLSTTPWGPSLAQNFAHQIAQWFPVQADGTVILPTYNGPRNLLGKRVPLPPGESHSLLRVHLETETGFQARDELVPLPGLLLTPNHHAHIELPGIVQGEQAVSCDCDEFRRTLTRVIAIWIHLTRDLSGMLLELLPEHLARPARSLWPNLKSAADLHSPDAMQTVFESSLFERNANRVEFDNPYLLALVLAESKQLSSRQRESIAQPILTWLSAQKRREPLPLPVQDILAQVTGLAPRTMKRLKGLLQTGISPQSDST